MGSYTLSIFVFLVAWLSIFLDPRKESQTHGDISIIGAPLSFVRQHILDFEYMRGLQLRNKTGVIDSLQVQRNGTLFAAENSLPGEILHLTDRNGSVRTASVVANCPDQFIYREDRPWAQRIYHNLTLWPDEGWSEMYGESVTLVSYQREWRGMPLLFWMRFFFPNLTPWIGEGLPEESRRLGLGNDAIWELQKAWKATKKPENHVRDSTRQDVLVESDEA